MIMRLSSDLIRPVQPADTDRLAAIYNHYVTDSTATFDERPLTNADMHSRIKRQDPGLPWFVLLLDDNVAGYACAVPWHERTAYSRTVEAAVYLAPECTGHGYGRQLFTALLDTLQSGDTHCVIAQIALPNESSIALVEKFGFEQTGELREVGRKFDRWVDVGLWQRTF